MLYIIILLFLTMVIAKVCFYDDVCRFDVRTILNTGKVLYDDDIQYGSLNKSLIMLSNQLELPLELLERSIERVEWL